MSKRTSIFVSRCLRGLVAALALGLTFGSNVHAAPTVPGRQPTPSRTDRYGDPLPPGVVARLGTVRLRHEGQASEVAFSPDGKILAAKCRGIVLWEAATGRELRRLSLHAPRWVSRPFAFAPDGKLLAALNAPGNTVGKIVFWEVATGKQVRAVPMPGLSDPEGAGLRYSPDGMLLAVACQPNKVCLLDANTGRVLREVGGRASLYDLAFSPDGKLLALGTQSPAVRIWDVSTGRPLRGVDQKPDDWDARAVAFSPDGKALAVGRSDHVALIDVATGRELFRLKDQLRFVCGLAFAPDGKSLVSISYDGKVRVWDLAGHKLRREFDGRWGSSNAVAVSPDGRTAALGSMGRAIRLWDIDTGKELFTRFDGHADAIREIAFAPDGRTLLTGGDDQQIRLWDARTWQQVRQLRGSAYTLSLTPDGTRLATVSVPIDTGPHPNNTIHVWDVAAGRIVARLPIPITNRIQTARFAPDGRTLVSADQKTWRTSFIGDTHLRIWDTAARRQLRQIILPETSPKSLVLTRDGRIAILSALDGRHGQLLFCDLELGKVLRALPALPSWTTALALSPDGALLLLGSFGHGLRLREADTGEVILALRGHRQPLSAVAFAPDGRVAASAGGLPHSHPVPPAESPPIRLWDVATGQEIGQLRGHRADVSALAFSPDGNRLVSALGDSSVLVWDVSTVARAPRLAVQDLGPKDLERLWSDLAGEDAGKAHRAVWTLVAAPRQALPFLAKRLRPIAPVDPKRIRRWIAGLDSAEFSVRSAADQELEKAGRQAEPALRQALESKSSLEVKRRAEKLLLAIHALPSGEVLRTLRAIRALEHIGSPDARQVLRALAGGAAAAQETQAAKSALERLKRS